jgi:hypothetical protein
MSAASLRPVLGWARCWYAALLACFVCTVATNAAARAPLPAPPAPSQSTMFTLTVLPLLGKLSAGNAPQEVVVRVESRADAPTTGMLTLEAAYSNAVLATAGVALAPKSTTYTRLVVGEHDSIKAVLRDNGSVVLADAEFHESAGRHAIFHAAPTSRLLAVRDWTLSSTRVGKQNASLGTPPVDRSSGDLLLPELVTTYADVGLVLIGSAQLAHIKEKAFATLLQYVNAGGTLALIMERPEDLRAERVLLLTGGPLRVDAEALRLVLDTGASREKGIFAPGTAPKQETDDEAVAVLEESEDAGAHASPPLPPAGEGSGQGSSAAQVHGRPPSDMVGYAGGNLVAGKYGSVAAYGVGRVVLLPHDPGSPANADNRWVVGGLVGLLAESNEHAQRGFWAESGAGGFGSSRDVDKVRKILDPNENFRIALGVSALILLLYGTLFFPLAFGHAARKGLLFAPLKWTPMASAATFLLIVLTGFIARGVRSSAQHVAFVNLGAGAHVGHELLYRGFFSSGSKEFSATTFRKSGSLRLSGERGNDSVPRYRMTEDALTLEGVQTKPWSTIVVREDGQSEDFGTVDVKEEQGDLVVQNNMVSELTDVVVWSPKTKETRYFAKIEKGGRVRRADGIRVMHTSLTLGGPRAFSLDLSASTVPSDASARIEQSWGFFDANYDMDFWPSDTPVVIATVHPPLSTAKDMGLSLRKEATYVRIVGGVGVSQ